VVSAVLRNATCDLIVATVVIILDFDAAQTQDVSFGKRFVSALSRATVVV
jgi:hypothetical protein